MGVPATAAEPSANLDDVLGGPKLKLAPSPMFFLEHRPLEMGGVVVRRVHGEDVWVPELNPIPVYPGAVGMRTRDRGEDPSKAYVKALQIRRELDHIVLPGNLVVPDRYLPAGVAPGPAVRWQAVEGGRRYLLAWETVYKGLGNQARQELTDEEGYAAWRLSLVHDGTLPEPHREVIADAIRRQEGRVARAERETNLSAEVHARNVSAAATLLDRMRAARIPRRGEVSTPVAAPDVNDLLAELREERRAREIADAERADEAARLREQVQTLLAEQAKRAEADAVSAKAEADKKAKAEADKKADKKAKAEAEARPAADAGAA